MENKLPEEFLTFYESLFSAQLRVVRQFKNPKSGSAKSKKRKGMSNIDMAIDILQRSKQPLHISEVITQAKVKHGVTLNRESLVSALVKKVHQNQGLIRTAPNTFQVSAK
jgi:hypothetical protein